MCSVADAESVALWKAISLAEKQTGRIEILTDSKWAIQDTLHPLPNRELSHKIKMILVKARGRIKIRHIPAHSGNPGNSLADVLAKSFREKKTLDPYMGRMISIDELKKHMEEWEQNQWDSENEAHLQQEWKRNPALWEDLRKKSRRTNKRIIELLTGHGNFQDMMLKKGQTTKTICRLCQNAAESNTHIWRDCQKSDFIPETLNPSDPKLNTGSNLLNYFFQWTKFLFYYVVRNYTK